MRRMGPNRLHKGPQVYGPHSAFKIIVQAPCESLIGSLRGLKSVRVLHAVGSFDFLVIANRCSKIRMASARAHMTSTCTCPLWKHRGHACVIEIRFLKHTANPVNACMYATMHVAGG